MQTDNLNAFIELIREQFEEEERGLINGQTDLRSLKEWSSLQTMIIVSEIDREYNVILGFEDIKKAGNVEQLFRVVQTKMN